MSDCTLIQRIASALFSISLLNSRSISFLGWTLPISYEAYELCGMPDTGKVFKGLKRSMINYPLKNWLKKAGITKPITFHGFRHSYAVIQISLGTDIYTVSKMLTHKNVSTTQIYADLVNAKKRETANKISLK